MGIGIISIHIPVAHHGAINRLIIIVPEKELNKTILTRMRERTTTSTRLPFPISGAATRPFLLVVLVVPLILSSLAKVSAWTTARTLTLSSSSSSSSSRRLTPYRPSIAAAAADRATTVLFAGGGGGFGGGGSSDKKKKKGGGGAAKAANSAAKLAKLKPKQQWDRFLSMKRETAVRVAVRTTSTEDGGDGDDGNDDNDDAEEWLEVGNVKSVDSQYTALAVARQRALIADHAKRLFPLQISIRDTITWAYWNDNADKNDDDDESSSSSWTVVDKVILNDANAVPANLEKLIGFEGRPDPSSGYYCVYNEGRLVNDADDARPSSKKLK